MTAPHPRPSLSVVDLNDPAQYDPHAYGSSVASTLSAHTWRWRDEYELQDLVADQLTAAGFEVQREVRLSARDRIDVLVDGDVGVEVKVAGSIAAVHRQLLRYAEHETIRSLVLFTTKALHRRLHLMPVGDVLVEVVQPRWV